MITNYTPLETAEERLSIEQKLKNTLQNFAHENSLKLDEYHLSSISKIGKYSSRIQHEEGDNSENFSKSLTVEAIFYY